MLKLSVTEGVAYPTGWHIVTISDATDGDFEGTRWIDLHFKGLPDNLKTRVWSAVNAETGEDFGIGNLFYYANAGLTVGDDGQLTIDDSVTHLKGKTLNILFYENENGFTDGAQRVVPVVREGFSEAYVQKLKVKTETWVSNRGGTWVTSGTNGATTTKTVTKDEAVPF